MSVIQEFKQFALRGNVVDLAIGVIIGAAFGKIVSSLVADVIMPPVGVLVGGVNFANLGITLQSAMGDQPEVRLKYGAFLQAVTDFLIIAAVIFLMVKIINSLRKKEEAKPTAPPPPTREEVLLTEIRDAVRSR